MGKKKIYSEHDVELAKLRGEKLAILRLHAFASRELHDIDEKIRKLEQGEK